MTFSENLGDFLCYLGQSLNSIKWYIWPLNIWFKLLTIYFVILCKSAFVKLIYLVFESHLGVFLTDFLYWNFKWVFNLNCLAFSKLIKLLLFHTTIFLLKHKLISQDYFILHNLLCNIGLYSMECQEPKHQIKEGIRIWHGNQNRKKLFKRH